jgi:hypothetical protein
MKYNDLLNLRNTSMKINDKVSLEASRAVLAQAMTIAISEKFVDRTNISKDIVDKAIKKEAKMMRESCEYDDSKLAVALLLESWLPKMITKDELKSWLTDQNHNLSGKDLFMKVKSIAMNEFGTSLNMKDLIDVCNSF